MLPGTKNEKGFVCGSKKVMSYGPYQFQWCAIKGAYSITLANYHLAYSRSVKSTRAVVRAWMKEDGI